MAYEERRKARKANQMQLEQAGKNHTTLQAKTASQMDLYYCITEVLCHDFG